MTKRRISTLLLGVLLGSSAVAAQSDDIKLLDRWLIWDAADTMVARHLTSQVVEELDRRAATIAGLRTRDDWLKRQEHVRSVMDRVIGSLPDRFSPMNARLVGSVQKNGYRIEKIIYESMPRLYVTGCLLIPDNLNGRGPAILYTAGSSLRTFRVEQYQHHILNLVRNGYIVFAIDPIGQGERIQYYDRATDKSLVNEFNHTAHQCFLIGTSYAKYYVRDAVRALDYLQTRNEVDPQRIGMGGLSWGGWQCTLVTALDPRITAGASAAGCNVGIRRWFQSQGPTSAGQHYPGFVSAGLDHADFFELIAPRAFLRMSTTLDYKVIQGARETYAEYQQAFDALGARDKLDFTEDDTGHGYTPKNNEAAYRFYQRHLTHSGPVTFAPVELMSDADTTITPTGQVVTSFKDAAGAFEFNLREAGPLLQRLDAARRSPERHVANVRQAAARIAGVHMTADPSPPVFTGRHRRDGYAVETYVLPGESGYVIPLLLMVPDGSGPRRAVIYLHPGGKSAAQADSEVRKLREQGYIVALPDVAGTGETRNRRGDFRSLQYMAIMINRNMVGLHAGDIMRVRAFLKSKPEGHEVSSIGVVGVGTLGPAVLHAAALDESLTGVVLVDCSLSYRSVVTHALYKTDPVEMIAGALEAYDLPDLLACIAPRRAALIAPADHMRKTAASAVIDEELAFPRRVFAMAGKATHLRAEPAGMTSAAMVGWSVEPAER